MKYIASATRPRIPAISQCHDVKAGRALALPSGGRCGCRALVVLLFLRIQNLAPERECTARFMHSARRMKVSIVILRDNEKDTATAIGLYAIKATFESSFRTR